MKDYKSWADEYSKQLASLYDADESRQIFLLAYSFIRNKKAVHYALERHTLVEDGASIQFLHMLQELQRGRPIQHIIGEADFYGLRFKVNEHTLIPRPETEELVDWIIQEYADIRDLTILDIGTGSGCIAISLAKHLPNARVDALDISKEAIAVARENAVQLGVPVNFIQADILEWDSFMQDSQRYTVVVSNPPYITPKEQAGMHSNVLQYEPHLALFVEEHNPLLFYDVAADLAKKHMESHGALFFEINQYLAEQTVDLLRKKGFGRLRLRKDLNHAARMISAKQIL
ncbi:peptide chain release factor N(5)-glutamine methyltransferase [Sphingobacterium griseoflavum]|uniref:Release factor glutamine methyltransferase n=1 Tax=Sphingobacterium griseoflavum TaxID=1474952 RepID=A0ABQ3HVF7_9SPHI|nr:peptide chain release factor N(5)-glutamine methyltransferase [Sphingobacterium griseoflavum]GHE30499.1 release factor glutamine methyltransferase [Sphingobacterium griseoflavum]